MLDDNEICDFEKGLLAIRNSRKIDEIPLLMSVLDDETEHEEIMFGVIHCIEYIYQQDEYYGLSVMINSLCGSMDQGLDWLKILHYRILNDEHVASSYLAALKNANANDTKCAINILTAILNEDADIFGSKIRLILNAL